MYHHWTFLENSIGNQLFSPFVCLTTGNKSLESRHSSTSRENHSINEPFGGEEFCSTIEDKSEQM